MYTHVHAVHSAHCALNRILCLCSGGHYKTWTVDSGLDPGLDYGLKFGPNFT